MSDADWFTYFLHPERLDADFGPQSSSSSDTPRWSSSNERRAAGVQVLRGLLSSSNFREYIISAYPTLRDAHGQSSQKYAGPTPPSTPKSPSNGGVGAGSADVSNISRMAQCSRFSVSPATGLPSDNLAAVLKLNDLPELSARRARLLAAAKQLCSLLRFDVEEVESAVHATIRFMYYLNLLPLDSTSDISSDTRFQIHRWIVRSAYREEDIGLSMEVERTPAMDASCQELAVFAEALDEADQQLRSLKFRVAYDVARLYLAQSRFSLALDRFRECQRIDPARCMRDKFKLAVGRPKPSVDEYATACATIVQSLTVAVDPRMATSTPTDQLRNMYISGPAGTRAAPVLTSESDYLRALEHCLTAALEAVSSCTDASLACNNLSWLACVHPPLIQYCARLSADDLNAVKTRLQEVAGKWTTTSVAIGKIGSLQVEELKRQSETIVDFITSSWPELSASSDLTAAAAIATTEESQSSAAQRATIAEDQLQATQTLELDLSKVPLAATQLSYCYLSGLRLLEQERYKEAQTWFAHGLRTLEEASESQQQQQQGQAVMAQQAEKDRTLKLALAAQVEVHGKLANLLYQIEQGTEVNDLAEDIDAILETQTPIRFEFLEHLVLICLRQDNKSVFTKLVGTIATNQKLYQQLPEIHITLLQIASLLVVVRDVLHDVGIDISRELGASDVDGKPSSSCSLLTGAALKRLQSSVAEIAVLLLKIPIDAKSTAAVSIRATVGCVPQVGSRVENEIERFCRMWGDPIYLLLLGALLSEMLQRSSGKSVGGPLDVCELVAHIVGKRDGSEDIAVDGEEKGEAGATALSSIVQDALSSGSEQGQENIRHMRDIAFIVFTCAARESPSSACLWLYFSA
ncbi:hypothetical protein IWW47_001037, partial [Coemansia sp. RSA 2052]